MKYIAFFLVLAIFTNDCGNQDKTDNKEADSTVATSSQKENKTESSSKANTYIITNEGIADLKLGMHIEEANSLASGLTCEKVIMEIDEIEFYRIKSGEEMICQFELDINQNVAHIFVGDQYKTEKGIGTSSTIKDIKKQYTMLPLEIVEGAEGNPFVSVSVKELPNVQMWLDFYVSDEVYENKEKVLSSVPETAKVIGVYIKNILK